MWQTPKLNWTQDDYYNSEDLNRVENNTVEVSNLIKQLIGININLEQPITNRDYSSIEFADSFNRIERNLEKLKVLNLEGLRAAKTTWQTGDSFTFNDAIRYETNLSILYNVFSRNIGNVSYCGMITCGEDVI